jgi:predicted nucleotidyltransferase
MLTTEVSSSSSLFGRAREAVIGILFGEPGARFHVREIARQAGLSAPTIARELSLLKQAGVVKAEAVGNQLVFTADDSYPLAPELRSIAIKTWGVIGRLRTALKSRKDVEAAFVFGSYASGTAGPTSDIDLLVISDGPYVEYADMAARLSDELHRTVSLKLYRHPEWRKKRDEGNSFVVRLAKEQKIFVAGNEEVLGGGQTASGDAGAGMDPGAPAGKGRNRGAPKVGARSARRR